MKYNDDQENTKNEKYIEVVSLDNLTIQGSDLPKDPEERNDLNGEISGYLLFCLAAAVAGSAFQVGWAIGIYNTPFDTIRGFFNQVNIHRTGQPMSNSTFDLLWSITNGLMPLGAAFGGVCSGVAADYFGRRNALLLTNFFVIAVAVYNIISKFIKCYETLMVARFLSGIFSGLFTGILPLYLSELSPPNLRGLIGTLNQLTIVLGILATNVYGLNEVLGTDDLWPLLVGFFLVPLLAHVGLFFAVESPKHLYLNSNKPEEAENVLRKIRGGESPLVSRELKQLEIEKKNQSKQENIKWSDLLRLNYLRKPLFVALGVHIAQQFSGINAVIFYSTKIFDSVGLEGNWPTYATIILGVVQLVMTIVCMFIVDRAGRKALLMIGMIGMSVSSFGLAICRILATPDLEWLNYLTVVSAVAYIIFFSIGPGAIPWILTSEVFNSNARAKANSIAVFTNWFSAFIITISFPFIEGAIGNYSFVVFGVLLVVFALFIIFFVPETKNKSIEEVVESFNDGSAFAWKKNRIVRF